jgi:hypothetical protein
MNFYFAAEEANGRREFRAGSPAPVCPVPLLSLRGYMVFLIDISAIRSLSIPLKTHHLIFSNRRSFQDYVVAPQCSILKMGDARYAVCARMFSASQENLA